MAEFRHLLDLEKIDLYDHEALAVTNAQAVPLTVSKLVVNGLPCDYIFAVVEGNAVRYRCDRAGAPTTAVGLPRSPGDVLELVGPAVHALQWIATVGAATVQVSYGRKRR